MGSSPPVFTCFVLFPSTSSVFMYTLIKHHWTWYDCRYCCIQIILGCCFTNTHEFKSASAKCIMQEEFWCPPMFDHIEGFYVSAWVPWQIQGKQRNEIRSKLHFPSVKFILEILLNRLTEGVKYRTMGVGKGKLKETERGKLFHLKYKSSFFIFRKQCKTVLFCQAFHIPWAAISPRHYCCKILAAIGLVT